MQLDGDRSAFGRFQRALETLQCNPPRPGLGDKSHASTRVMENKTRMAILRNPIGRLPSALYLPQSFDAEGRARQPRSPPG